jgi:hypothetical protein
VFGAPRSGTTYLQEILNTHPDVFLSHETRIFGWLYNAIEILPQDYRLVVTYHDAFVEHIRSVLPELVRDFYRGLAPNVRYWGDKNPHYADERGNAGTLQLVADVFARSLFIHIIRDGRDVVSSMVQRPGEGKDLLPFEAAHSTWTDIVDHGAKFGRALPSYRYLELRYEDLISDDVGSAKEIFSFLDLDLDPAVETFCRNQQQERTPFSHPTRDLEQGVANSDWSRIFSQEEQLRSLELIGEQLVHYGYETEASLADLRERIASAEH